MSDIPKRRHNLTCLQCGSPFTALRPDAKYCSVSCQKKVSYRRGRGAELAVARVRNCQYCGKEFAPKRSDAKWCSSKCSSRAYYEENRERVLAFNRQWALDHPQETKAIKQRSEEKHGARHREAKRRRYAEVSADPERAEERHRKRIEYYDANRERALELERQRRAQDPFLGLYRRHGGIDWRELFASLWEAQDGKCYLCGDPLQPDAYRAIHLDHDHSCCKPGRSCAICRRGLACKPCNVLIGHAHDDPVRLRRIADNLEKANEGVAERKAEAEGQLSG